jgi:hypothetical protein
MVDLSSCKLAVPPGSIFDGFDHVLCRGMTHALMERLDKLTHFSRDNGNTNRSSSIKFRRPRRDINKEGTLYMR